MKKIALTTAIALGLAAPAFASSQLERSLGVAPGTYSTVQLAEMHNKQHLDQRNERVSNFSRRNSTFSTRGLQAGHSPRAQAIFNQLRAESWEDE